jgi:hypothetical protein
MAKTPNRPTIITQHEYISINFGNNRRLTASFRGEKAAGSIPQTVFNLFSKAVQDPAWGKNIGERIEKFVNDINTIWPEWNKPPMQFRVDQPVRYDFGPRRGGMDQGIVMKVGRSVTVRFVRSGMIRMAADLLEKDNA